MKKYLLGLFAIALAIGFSAFTSKAPTPTTKKHSTTDYYWYNVNVTQTQTTTLAFNDKINKDAAISGGSCNDTNDQPLCLAGFDTQVGSGIDVTGLSRDEKILRTP